MAHHPRVGDAIRRVGLPALAAGFSGLGAVAALEAQVLEVAVAHPARADVGILERRRQAVVARGLVEPALLAVERKRLLDLGPHELVAARAGQGHAHLHGREQRLVAGHLGCRPDRARHWGNPRHPQVDRDGVEASRQEGRRRDRDQQDPRQRAHHEERGEREDHAERAAEGRELGDAPITGHHQHGDARAQQQAARHDREEEAHDAVLGRPPQPVHPGKERDPGFRRPAMALLHAAPPEPGTIPSAEANPKEEAP